MIRRVKYLADQRSKSGDSILGEKIFNHFFPKNSKQEEEEEEPGTRTYDALLFGINWEKMCLYN